MDRQALAGHIFNLLGYSREIHDLVCDELGVVLDAPITGVAKAAAAATSEARPAGLHC